jgi:hypothetical protein
LGVGVTGETSVLCPNPSIQTGVFEMPGATVGHPSGDGRRNGLREMERSTSRMTTTERRVASILAEHLAEAFPGTRWTATGAARSSPPLS